ncbi:MAG: ROK family protein [Rhodospirillales bacterium]|nr:ROK family protein [Rhodospirillales bacterium]
MRIGIDLGGSKIEGIVIDERGGEGVRLRVPTPRGDYRKTLDAIVGLVARLESVGGRAGDPPATVGVGIPGAISPTTGVVKNANATWLIGHPLDRDLGERLARPVRVANDANCFAVSEAVDGAGAGGRVVFGVILGTGVGGGIAIERRAWTGANAIAGEWGHNPMPWPQDEDPPGEPCYCGLRGCIETYLSGVGLARAYARAAGRHAVPDAVRGSGDATAVATEGVLAADPDAAAITALAEAGDPAATAGLAGYAERLARALASVINVLDPDVIVLGGGLSNISRLYDDVPRLWRRWVFSDHVATALRRNRHGDSSGVRGAAWLWPN